MSAQVILNDLLFDEALIFNTIQVIGGGPECLKACGCLPDDDDEDLFAASLVCDEECKLICLRNGGGKDCITACGCKVENKPLVAQSETKVCNEVCKRICDYAHGGPECVTACGC